MQTIETLNLKLPENDKSLPSELQIIDFCEPKTRQTVLVGAESYLIIGSESGLGVGVNLRTGEVYLIDEEKRGIDVFMNSSIESLTAFVTKYRQTMLTKTSEEGKLQLLINLWQELKKLDPKALASLENTWWGEFLDDKIMMFGGDVEKIKD